MLHVQEIPREQRHHRREAERARQNSRYAHIRARMMSCATEYKPRYASKCERERQKRRPRKRERHHERAHRKRRAGSGPRERRRNGNAHHAPKRRLHASSNRHARGNVRSRFERGKPTYDSRP